MIRLVTDSSSDLPLGLAQEHAVEVVPLTIRFGDEEYVDREELTHADFWTKLSSSALLPETSAPGVGRFQDAYRKLAAEGADGVVAVCISSRLSATYQSAVIAAERLEVGIPVKVVDSATVSMALGFQVLEGARAAAAGGSLDAVAAAARSAVAKTNLLAALETLEFLKRGGRIGGAQAFFGGLLDVKPLVSFRDGVVAPAGRVRTRSKALAAIEARVATMAARLAEVAVLHGAAPDAPLLRERLATLLPADRVSMAELGPVVGTHSGPGVIGVAYRLY